MSSDPDSIQNMFSAVAPRYDLLNRILSLGLDKGWRRAAVQSMDLAAGDRALDLCCGTGALALDVARTAHPFACDFSEKMLGIARLKLGPRASLTVGDALRLPYAPGSFDAAAIAFGIRNLVDLPVGFEEVLRSTKGDGRFVILEFSRPRNRALRWLHTQYIRFLVPWIGRLLSPKPPAYRYLADTIVGFPEPQEIEILLRQVGFQNVSHQALSGGIVTLYRATV